MTKPKVYLASRLADQHLPHRLQLVRAAQDAHPDAEIIDGLDLWSSNAGWLASWQGLLLTLDRVVLIPGERGEVGLGQLQELVDGWTAGVPVEVATPAGVRPLERLRLGTEVLDLEDVAVAT